MIYLWQWSNGADIYSPGFGFTGNPFLMEFVSAPRTTMRWAPGHLDFPFFPVNLGVVFTKPGVSKQEFLFSQIGDTEGGPLRMIFVTEKETDGFCY